MIVEMGDYAWSEHIVTVFLALLTIHVQVDLAKRRRERTGSYPDGRGNGLSVQLVPFVVI
jgi:hypothetical protein